MVFLLVQATAAEAVAAAEAFFAEEAVGTVLAVLGVMAAVAFLAIYTLCAPFALHAEGDAVAATTLARVAGVVHVLAVEDAEAVVTVLRLEHGVGIVAVLGHHVFHREARGGEEKPLEIRDK